VSRACFPPAPRQPPRNHRRAVASLSADKVLYKANEPITLHVTITNGNDFPLKVLKWFTPVEGVGGPLFTVTRDGKPVTYIGPMIKRLATTDKDYITLAAGESTSSDVILSDYYDLSVSGNYEVMYDVSSIQLYAEENTTQTNRTGRLTSNKLRQLSA
jgi:peptidyl-Lys metalloendopeptidase